MSKKHLSSKQKEILIEYVTKRPEMVSVKLQPNYTREKCGKMWDNLTNILNSIPGAPAKTAKEWRKCFVDIKKNVKKKASHIKNYESATGGGPPTDGNLNDEDINILNIVKPTEVTGHPKVEESIVTFVFDESEILEDITLIDQENNDNSKDQNSKTITHDFEAASGHSKLNPNVEQIYYEHDYMTLSEIKENSTAKPPKPPKHVRKRDGRLEDSIETSRRLLEMTDNKNKMIEQYYTEKISYLKHKKQYDIEKLNVYKEILAEVKNICQSYH